MKKFFFAVLVMVFALSAFAEECKHHRQPGCQEILAINAVWDEANPLLRGLDQPAANDDQRLYRAENIGRSLWHAQHAGAVQSAGPASFLVFIWNGGVVSQPVGYSVTRDRRVMRYTAEVVTGKVTPAKLDGYGDPSAVYRVRTDGVSASILLPRSALNDKTFIVICREGKNGVYPNTVTLKQGHAISPVTLMWYMSQPEGSRILVPFVSRM